MEENRNCYNMLNIDLYRYEYYHFLKFIIDVHVCRSVDETKSIEAL